MAEGLPAELIVLILQHVRCHDLPAARLVCRRWAHVVRNARVRCWGCSIGQHAVDALAAPKSVCLPPAQLAHIVERCSELPLWLRLELCFLPAANARMIRALVSADGNRLQTLVFARACQTGAVAVAQATLDVTNEHHLVLACTLLQMHGHSAGVLDPMLDAIVCRKQSGKLLAWCAQTRLDHVLYHVLHYARVPAHHLNAAFIECVVNGGDTGRDMARAIWEYAGFAQQFRMDCLRSAIEWDWLELAQASAPFVENAANFDAHLLRASTHGTPDMLAFIWPHVRARRDQYVGNAAFIAAICASRADNAWFLLKQTDAIIPVAMAQKRADVYFMCALTCNWAMLQCLLSLPGACPWHPRYGLDRLYRAILFNSAGHVLLCSTIIGMLLVTPGAPLPPKDVCGKLLELVREHQSASVAVKRAIMDAGVAV